MSKKTLNKANLEKLGADKLAALVMDLVQGSAALQRRARMELSAAQGPKDVAADLRKRFASLRRSTSYIDWRKQRALVKDLESLLALIETSILPQDANMAFELLWSFLQLAPSIHERTDDNNGAVGDVFRQPPEAALPSLADALELGANLTPAHSRKADANPFFGHAVLPACASLTHAPLAHIWGMSIVTVVETPEFQRRARSLMSEEERLALIDFVPRNPTTGVSIGGGVRKFRFARDGGGKSGGFRVIHFFSADAGVPIFLITVFAKNEKANLTARETEMVRQMGEALAASYRRTS